MIVVVLQSARVSEISALWRKCYRGGENESQSRQAIWQGNPQYQKYKSFLPTFLDDKMSLSCRWWQLYIPPLTPLVNTPPQESTSIASKQTTIRTVGNIHSLTHLSCSAPSNTLTTSPAATEMSQIIEPQPDKTTSGSSRSMCWHHRHFSFGDSVFPRISVNDMM